VNRFKRNCILLFVCIGMLFASTYSLFARASTIGGSVEHFSILLTCIFFLCGVIFFITEIHIHLNRKSGIKTKVVNNIVAFK